LKVCRNNCGANGPSKKWLLEGLFLFGEIKVRMSRLLLATTAGLMALNTKLSVLSALVASCGHASPLSCKANTVKSKPNKLSQKKKRL
ncbi:hypothetical protein ABTD79_18465, partial [Acinetobacter baumannii]